MARRPARVYTPHRCPRCQQVTTAKDYCPACLGVLCKPPMPRRSPLAPFAWERNEDGKRMRI